MRGVPLSKDEQTQERMRAMRAAGVTVKEIGEVFGYTRVRIWQVLGNTEKFKTDADRFWSHVDKRGPDDCWEWKDGATPQGYGLAMIGGHRTTAPRVSWILANGEIPDGLLVCHNCPDGDNPLCVNPAHLFLGTYKDNTQDMIQKGRDHFRGSASTITKRQVIA